MEEGEPNSMHGPVVVDHSKSLRNDAASAPENPKAEPTSNTPPTSLQEVAQEPADIGGESSELDGKTGHVREEPGSSFTANGAQLHDLPSQGASELCVGNMSGNHITSDIRPDDTEGLFPFPDLETYPMVNYPHDAFDASNLEGEPSIATSEEHQIQAFAKLEFDDGEFYINTYAVELGRDIRAARLAFDREPQLRDSKPRKRSTSSGGGSVKSGKAKRGDERNMASSVVSESGGVIGVDPPELDLDKKLSRKKSKSASSSSQQLSRKSSMQLPKTDYNALAMASLMDHSSGMHALDTETHLPSPDMTPLIPIHPPAIVEGGSAGHKSISRKHIRIAFNFERHLFEVEILGRNGGFVDDEWYAPGDRQPLVNGSVIQIGGVGIRFVLPDVPPGETGADLGMGSDPLTGGKMSFDLADSDEEEEEEEEEDEEDEEEDEEEEGEEEEGEVDEAEEEEEDEDANAANIKGEEESEEGMSRTRAKVKVQEEPEPPKPKRKGPGRPPKNGIISKREQALLARQAREEAKAAAQRKPGTAAGRDKGKSVKALELEESLAQPSGKRKYTKRKRAGGEAEEQQVRESTEHTDSVPPERALPPKPTKEKKSLKPPRSPSPVYDESKMTPEQLAKPQSSYVVLIHEALSNSKTGQMSLPQIYRAIERRYPFYKLRVQTQGWQSSVRHNLSQHPAFRKIERDGKGWMWGLVPEVSIEKEKKRRATPPPAPQQHYYPPPPPMMQHPYPYPGMPPNGHLPPLPYGMHPHMPRPPPLGPSGFPLPLANAQSESNYQSPYQPTAPPKPVPAPPASQSEPPSNQNGVNGSYLTPALQPSPPQQSQQIPGTHQPNLSNPLPAPNGHQQPQTSPPPYKHGQDVIVAVSKFKAALIDSMSDKTRAEAIVTSAINRTLGNQSTSSFSEEDTQETAIMTALANMLGNLSKKNEQARTQGSERLPPPPPSSNSPTAETNGQGGETRERTVAELAADIAKRIPLMSGDLQDVHAIAGTKRSLEVDGADEAREPEAKRVTA